MQARPCIIKQDTVTSGSTCACHSGIHRYDYSMQDRPCTIQQDSVTSENAYAFGTHRYDYLSMLNHEQGAVTSSNASLGF